MTKLKTVEYIWLDGSKPVSQIRSKTRVIELPEKPKIINFPEWSFDGSSTGQASGDSSDCLLNPVCIASDPIENGGDYLCIM